MPAAPKPYPPPRWAESDSYENGQGERAFGRCASASQFCSTDNPALSTTLSYLSAAVSTTTRSTATAPDSTRRDSTPSRSRGHYRQLPLTDQDQTVGTELY